MCSGKAKNPLFCGTPFHGLGHYRYFSDSVRDDYAAGQLDAQARDFPSMQGVY